MSKFGEGVYFFTLLATAVATVLLIAPTVHHRLAFRQQDKEYLVVSANRLMLAGLAVLALAIVGAMVLVTDFLFEPAATTAIAAWVRPRCSSPCGWPSRSAAGVRRLKTPGASDA